MEKVQEISRPLAAGCACAAVRRASRAVTQLFDTVLSPSGLKSTQFIILHLIDAYGEVPQWRLAREQAVSVATLSRRLGAMRRKRLITLANSAEAHNERVYRLTPEGKQALQAGLPYWRRAQSRLEQALGAEAWERLIPLAGEITAGAHKALTMKVQNIANGAAAGQ